MKKGTSMLFNAMLGGLNVRQVYRVTEREALPRAEQDRRIGAAQAKRDRKNLKRLRDSG